MLLKYTVENSSIIMYVCFFCWHELGPVQIMQKALFENLFAAFVVSTYFTRSVEKTKEIFLWISRSSIAPKFISNSITPSPLFASHAYGSC